MFTSICISKVVRSDLSFLLELSLGVIKMIFFTELLSLLLTVYLYLFENGQVKFPDYSRIFLVGQLMIKLRHPKT